MQVEPPLSSKPDTVETLRLEEFLGTNRHAKRRERAEARKRIRVLRKLSATAENFEALLQYVATTEAPVVTNRLRRDAYAAQRAGRITEADARLFGCIFRKER